MCLKNEMKFEKKYTPEESAPIMEKLISRYVDRQKLLKRGLLWNSLKDSVERACLPFSQAASLEFFRDQGSVCLYDEREAALYRVAWREAVQAINALEPWEENVDLLLFDRDMDWFLAVTHEDLLAICGGNACPGSAFAKGDFME